MGEVINVFRRGTIVSNEPELSTHRFAQLNPIMFGTVDGGLGIIVQISDDIYEYNFKFIFIFCGCNFIIVFI